MRVIPFLCAALLVLPCSLSAQAVGTVTGTVTRRADGSPIARVQVSVQGTNLGTVTGSDGRYVLERVPAGRQTVLFRWLGYRPQAVEVTVPAGGTATVDAVLEAQPVALEEVVVTASRTPERVVEAPAAVAIADIPQVRSAAITGQMARAVANIPGVDLVQSGISDFNLNTRGFNSSLNRRVLVLQDGRDLAIAFLGSQEWNANPPLEDAARVEMVRGPGSALYGANAFSGVLSITTPPARAIRGTKISLSGGELSTFKGEFRHAGVFSEGRFGYKLSGSYYTSDTWTRSRTRLDGTDIVREYSQATSATIPPEGRPEVLPLAGQSKDPTTGEATGDRDPIVNIHGTARLDYYAANSIATIEGGAAQVENEVFVTGIGRVQVLKAFRPWARINWSHENYNLMAWYSGRDSKEPQKSLLSGLDLQEQSSIYHVEGQYNRSFLDEKARIVLGASYRNYRVNTQNTLMAPNNDDRSDNYYSVYGQLEYQPIPELKLVAASRFDDGTLFKGQFSPKGAVVFSPNEDHSIRFTVNRAFQTPNYSEFFLRVPVAPPTTAPRTLERGIEQFFQQMNASGIGAGLNLPNDLPWNFDSLTHALALGNAELDVEKVTGWEIGYKGNFAGRGFFTIDGYLNELKNFVTDLLPASLHPGTNPLFTKYSLTDQGTNVPKNLDDLEARATALRQAGAITPQQEAQIKATIAALRTGYAGLVAQAGPLLATYGNSRALILSYANAGRVIERGIEIGAGYFVTPSFKIEGSYAFFDFDVKDQILGDSLLPNTPKHKGAITLSYSGTEGLDASVTARLVDEFRWAAGVYAGPIPASQMIDVNLGYQVNNYVRLHLVATNLLDQKRYTMYGGSVIGRRVLGGVTATF
ncbi:Colicin I receptor [bacterium HR33]|nr:Colicin I receptor [bacterium HR33]